jgi:type VI protein secretion system component VasF
MTLRQWQDRERRRRILAAVLAWGLLTLAAAVTVAGVYGGLLYLLVTL